MAVASCGTLTALTVGLPSSTAIPAEKGVLPKQLFFAKQPISSKLKQRLVNDVESVTMLALLRSANTNLDEGTKVKEILVIGLELNCQEIPADVVEYISHMRNCGIIFICRRLSSETDKTQLEEFALAVRRPIPAKPGHEQLYKVHVGPWRTADKIQLKLVGQNLDQVWDSLNAQAILDSLDGADLDLRIQQRNEIAALVAQEAKLSKDHSRAKNPAQRNEIYAKLHKIRTQLKQMGALD